MNAPDPFTNSTRFDEVTNDELAFWLEIEAINSDGQTGQRNHAAVFRAAAERLRKLDKANAKLAKINNIAISALGRDFRGVLDEILRTVNGGKDAA